MVRRFSSSRATASSPPTASSRFARLAMSAVRLGVRLVVMRRARFQRRELLVSAAASARSRSERAASSDVRDVGGDDRSLLARDFAP